MCRTVEIFLAIRLGRKHDPDGQIEPLGHQINPLVRQIHIDSHVRMRMHEFAIVDDMCETSSESGVLIQHAASPPQVEHLC